MSKKKESKRFCGECSRCNECGKTEAEHMKCPTTPAPYVNPYWHWPYVWYSQSIPSQTGTIYTTPSITVTSGQQQIGSGTWAAATSLEVNQ